MIERRINSVRCTSMGRLFDAAGLLIGLGRRNSFEGQIPLGVEAIASGATNETSPLSFPLSPSIGGSCLMADWQPAMEQLSDPWSSSPAERAMSFHQGLASLIVDVAMRANVRTVALSGGCFQNALLLDLSRSALVREGFEVLSHQILPPGDGSIAAGQALGALWGIGTVGEHAS